MKKFFAVPLAVVFVAACSDSSTAPSATADLAPSYGKPTPPPTNAGCTTCTVNTTFDFQDGTVGAAGGATIGTAPTPGAASSSAADVVTAPGGQKYLGYFQDIHTMVVINVPAGSSKYNLDFDLYIVGSWDGRGKQAQHGVFDANVLDVGYSCVGVSTTGSLFKTTFSNQLTVQQDYPLPYLQGGNKAGTGATAIDALNYKSRPDLSNTPQFRSFGDAIYRLSFSGDNPCGTAGIQFQISTSNPLQQSAWDESWGVDNVTVKAGS